MAIELLQQIGFNKYEAEAYAALLQHGPMTGYELGKRSGVPLSRSYEILERLANKGLVLVQPGEPPRYTAIAPKQLLENTRTATNATLDALEQALAELGQPASEGFWVIRGREPVVAYARARIAEAQRTLAVRVAPAYSAAFEQAIFEARTRGCRVQHIAGDNDGLESTALLVLADEQQALVGTLAPENDAQAVAGPNTVLAAVLRRLFALQRPLPLHSAETAPVRERQPQSLDWLDWEERKQRRLLNALQTNHIA